MVKCRESASTCFHITVFSLGPLLFMLYINSLYLNVPYARFHFFANNFLSLEAVLMQMNLRRLPESKYLPVVTTTESLKVKKLSHY